MPTKALYAGSFDPITKGHLDVLEKATKTFDEVVIAMGYNQNKKRLFSMDFGTGLIAGSLNEHFGYSGKWEPDDSATEQFVNEEAGRKITIGRFAGSVMKYAKQLGCTHIVRGFRQAGDFNDEFTLAGVAGHIDRDIIFTHFICREEFLHISSSTARELASIGEDVSWLVTSYVEQALLDQFRPLV